MGLSALKAGDVVTIDGDPCRYIIRNGVARRRRDGWSEYPYA
jgi:hypothetical protein